ncbi:MFS transporter [Kitasatospora sp. NPDC048538]|uniref:MDR family MFS transporter n=1 Tax=unclassified Kitasatospora TaxID=2633591 RepID=UPI0033FE2721
MLFAAPANPRIRRVVQETVGGLPRQFWWLWVSTLVNRLGAFVVTFLALYLTSERGYSPFYAGLVASLFGLGAASSAIVAGVLTDRIGRRPTLVAAQLGAALFTAVLGFADGRVAIAVVAFLVGFCNNATRPATSAIIADIVPVEDRVRAYSLNFWAINLGFGLSSAVAGVIATHGYLALFLLDALSTVLCAVVIFVRIPETKPDAPAAKSAEPAVGIVTVFRDRRFMAVVGLTLVLALVLQQGSTTLAVEMGRWGITSTQYGLVIGLNGLLIVLLQIPLTRWVEGRSRTAMLAAAALFIGWGFGLTALAGSSAWFYALTVAVWTIGEILYTPTLMGLIAELSPTHARGRYQGVYSLSWSLASFLGPAAGGLLLERAGGGVLWTACGMCGTAAAVGYVLLARRPGPAAVGGSGATAVVATAPVPPTAVATAAPVVTGAPVATAKAPADA